MDSTLLSAVLACSCLGAVQAAASPFSASLGYGIAKVEGGEVNAPYLAPYTLSDDTTYLRFAFGYDLSRYFALEASYYYFQNIDAEMSWGGGPPPFPSYIPARLLAWEIRTLALGPTFTWKPSERSSLHTGVAYTLTTSDTSLYAGRYGSFQEESDNVGGFEAHLTLDFAVSERWGTGINVAFINFGTEMGTSSDVSALTGDLHVAYRF